MNVTYKVIGQLISVPEFEDGEVAMIDGDLFIATDQYQRAVRLFISFCGKGKYTSIENKYAKTKQIKSAEFEV